MEKFLNLEDKAVYYNQAAGEKGISSLIMEKDFWVCWTLKTLYSIPSIAEHITFKGGTSLSKAHGGLIQRFSEDIDLVINKGALNGIKDASEPDLTRNELDRRIKTLKAEAQRYVKEEILPKFSEECNKSLKQDTWSVEIDPDDKDKQTILFHYPAVLSYSTGGNWIGGGFWGGNTPTYIRPRVKLEFGARGDRDPSELKIITPYIREFMDEVSPGLFQNPECSVPTLSAERTFWEKVTILHALHHKKKKIALYMSRHYYDVCQLGKIDVSQKAITNPNLLEQVVKSKKLYFADNNASYETATIGSLRLSPSLEIIDDLKADYQRMSGEMLMGTPPTFEDIMAELKSLEARVNKLSD